MFAYETESVPPLVSRHASHIIIINLLVIQVLMKDWQTDSTLAVTL